MAMTKICPVYLKERRIRELMAEFNCSYKKALLIYVPPFSRPSLSEDPPLPTQSAAPPKESSFPTSQYASTEKNSGATYAKVTKTKTGKSKKNTKGDKRDSNLPSDEMDEDILFESASETSSEDRAEYQPREEKTTKNRGQQISWKILLKKLKEKVMEEGKWEEKIKECGSIIFEAFLSFIVQFILDQPCCNFIKQLWITTTHYL